MRREGGQYEILVIAVDCSAAFFTLSFDCIIKLCCFFALGAVVAVVVVFDV